MKLLGNAAVYRQLIAGEDVASILESVDKQTEAFRTRRKPYLLYPSPASDADGNLTHRRERKDRKVAVFRCSILLIDLSSWSLCLHVFA